MWPLLTPSDIWAVRRGEEEALVKDSLRMPLTLGLAAGEWDRGLLVWGETLALECRVSDIDGREFPPIGDEEVCM